jgi:hypothetical protein
VDDVKVLGRKSINWFTTSCFGNGCIGIKGEGELASVAEDTAIGCGDNLLVISKPTTTSQLMELLRGEQVLESDALGVLHGRMGGNQDSG